MILLLGIAAALSYFGLKRLWIDFWERRCHACWIDGQRVSGPAGTKRGAVTSVLLGHTCWRRGWTAKARVV